MVADPTQDSDSSQFPPPGQRWVTQIRYGETKWSSKSSPEDCGYLLSWWTTKFVIHPVLEDPHHRSYYNKGEACDTPHLQSERLQECPSTRFKKLSSIKDTHCLKVKSPSLYIMQI
ncbi:hypothetical protein MUK42_36934 [Musa troglodytarum]|uniref:Uncharacterized protein n=1 Tax=Musa troglodytarum TaxID=320322 RepID=A0A9E7JCS6_9LILI|nr:hypothetical protein MUK42_36934 [Musa troglodytarum]